MNSNLKRNLVIGSGKGYNWYTWEPFVRSFVKNVQNADLVLFVDELSDFTRHVLEQVGKEIQGGSLKLVPFPDDIELGMPVNGRWKMFLKYLKNYGDDYEQVFVSDTRDVVFQENIFDCFADQKNFLAYAAEADDIKGNKTGVDLNYMWIEECFGKNEADKLADRDIICGGTTIATVNEMKVYIQKMLEFWPKDWDFHGVDQALYQHIVHNNLLPIKNLIKMDCWKGTVFTAYLFHEYNPVKIKDDLILRGDGKVPAVVHQYDRNETLIELIDKIYRDYNYKCDENFSDTKNEIEKLSYLVRNEDLTNTLNFFVTKFAGKAELNKYGLEFIECWKILLSRDVSSFQGEMLNVYFQNSIIEIFKDGLLINQGREISECLKLCEKNSRTVISGFKDWFEQKIIKAVKWHILHNNSPRYPGCIRLMIDMNLTSNEYFYFLMAELFRILGNIEQSAGCYEQVLKYQNKRLSDRLGMWNDYYTNLLDESKFISDKMPDIIVPNKNGEVRNRFFDDKI